VKHFDSISLTSNQYQALTELRQCVGGICAIEQIILYGSVARGEEDAESDLDLLMLTAQPLSRPMRHEITDVVFEVNLRYGTNISTLVIDRHSWEKGPVSVLPLRDEILKDGVLL
jgi:predicted nucleotidyltransferase